MSESNPIPDPAAQTSAISANNADTNVALQTARLIERDLLRQVVPTSALASEKDLMRRYGVGRPALREAIRILQCHGLIQMRRGPNGGLITVFPPLEKVVLPVMARLRLLGLTEQQVKQARMTLSLVAARVTLARRQRSALLREAPDSQDWHREALLNLGFRSKFPLLLACATGNAGLVVFARLAAHAADGANFRNVPSQANAEETRWMDACERAIIAALESADNGTPGHLLKIYHERIDQAFHVGEHTDAIPSEEIDTLTHRATRLVRTIVLSILDNGYSGGERLGSLEHLSTAFHASTATVQQALRILEADGVVRVRRGRGLGVFVSTPDPEAMADSLRDYLHGRGLATQDAAELTQALCIELLLQRLQDSADENDVDTLSAFLAARPGDAAAFSAMSAWLQTNVTHNPILGLLAKVLAAR